MEENKAFKYAAYLGCFIFIVAVCWYLLREPDVSNQRERANDVVQSLDSAGAEQRNAQKHIERIGQRIDDSIGYVENIERGIDEAQSRIADVQERSGKCAELLEDSERRIAESERIIHEVRSRAR